MSEFMKLYGALIAKGFATSEEKSKLKELAEDDTAPASAEEKVEEVNDLPEADPAAATDDVADEETAEQVEKFIKEAVEKGTKGAVKAATEAIQKQFASFVASQKNLIEKRSGIYHTEISDERKAANKRVKNFLEALTSKDVARLKDLTGSTANKGGYTIDPVLEADINLLLTEYGVARREMNVVPMKTRQLLTNTLVTDVDVYWTDEGGAKTSSDIVIGQVALNLKKLSVIVPWTDELAEDTEIDIIRFLADRIAENVSKKEDQAFFNGDGTSGFGGFTGVLNSAQYEVTLSGTTFASFDADDLHDMIDLLPQGAHRNAKFYMHRTIMSVVRRLKDSEGNYIYQRPSEGGPTTIWGYPVVFVEAMPSRDDSAEDTPFIVFGDLRKAYWVGVHTSGMKMDISNEATIRNTAGSADIDLFRQDMSALRVVQRVGGVTVLANALVVLKTAAASA